MSASYSIDGSVEATVTVEIAMSAFTGDGCFPVRRLKRQRKVTAGEGGGLRERERETLAPFDSEADTNP